MANDKKVKFVPAWLLVPPTEEKKYDELLASIPAEFKTKTPPSGFPFQRRKELQEYVVKLADAYLREGRYGAQGADAFHLAVRHVTAPQLASELIAARKKVLGIKQYAPPVPPAKHSTVLRSLRKKQKIRMTPFDNPTTVNFKNRRL